MSTTAADLTSQRTQSRPALQLAIGSLPGTEQSHVQISLRVISSKLRIPCVTVLQNQGDITLEPCPDRADALCLTSRHSRRVVERPVRLVPLSDALSELIDEILQREDGSPGEAHASAAAVSPSDAHDAPAAPVAVDLPDSIAAALINRSLRGPLSLRTADGLELVVDEDYHTAWTSLPDHQLADALALGAAVTEAHTIGPASFVQRTGKGSGLHALSVEQIAWLAPVQGAVQPTLERWLSEPQARLSLVTWPNLSVQSDYPQWLELLAALSARSMTVADAMSAGGRIGIGPGRLRQGLALLCVFRHAELERGAVQLPPAAPAESVFAAPPALANAAAREAAGSGILGRLKARFRSLIG